MRAKRNTPPGARPLLSLSAGDTRCARTCDTLRSVRIGMSPHAHVHVAVHVHVHVVCVTMADLA